MVPKTVLRVESRETEYIARISHGKDSLKMLDVIVSRGLPLDRITTTDIWATDTIRGEHPRMVAFKERCDEYIWRKYHIEVEHLCAMKDGEKVTYEKLFYHVPKRRAKKSGGGTRKGRSGDSRICGTPGASQTSNEPQGTRIQGFPAQIGSWCKKLKIDDLRLPLSDRAVVPEAQILLDAGFSQSPATRGGKNIVTIEYLGIAADEPKRFGQLNDRKRAPLVEFGIEEELCGLHCQYEGILGPAYDTGCRDGCWMCHNQGVNQLRLLRRDYPELWVLLLKWDEDSPVSFHPDGHTVRDFDRRFALEDEGLLRPGDPCFRWAQLDEDLQYSLL